MKTVLSVVALAVFITTAPTAFAKSKPHGPYKTSVHTTYMKDDPLVCKQSMQYPEASGSAAMAKLPESVLLYNYRHVTGPNPVLLRKRALGGLRCFSDLDNSGYMIGLRGAFEAMGATVSISKDAKKISVAKPGLQLALEVGKPSIVLNGEERPLDVPPMVARGIIYVPIRVISESLGGYVIWDGAQRSVVIRYLPPATATPPPTPVPTPTPSAEVATPIPTAIPTAAPTAVPAARPTGYEHFIVGDYLFAPKSYSALSAGNGGGGSSFAARAAFEIPLGSLPVLIGGDYRNFTYAHTAAAFAMTAGQAYTACPQNGFSGCASIPGRTASVYVPAYNGNDSSVSGNVGIGLGAHTHTYLEASFISLFNNIPSTYPSIPTLSGVGFGVERLPDLAAGLSFYGSVYYYPSVGGTYNYPAGLPPPTNATSANLQESIFKYQVGLTARLGSSGLFADAGVLGDSIRAKNLAPSDASHSAGLVGLGLNF